MPKLSWIDLTKIKIFPKACTTSMKLGNCKTSLSPFPPLHGDKENNYPI